MQPRHHLVIVWQHSPGPTSQYPCIHGSSGTELYVRSQAVGGTDLLGALLATRYGADLADHIRVLLERFSRSSLPSDAGFSLADAYVLTCLVSLHGDEKAIRISDLALSVGLSEHETASLVALRLGREAATRQHGELLAARHPAIAETVLSLTGTGRTHAELLQRYVSAVTRHHAGKRWDKRVQGVAYIGQRLENEELALAAMAGAVNGDPLQLRLRSAQLGVLRDHEHLPEARIAAEEAWRVFDDANDRRIAGRRLFREWARIEGMSGDLMASAALNACALLDHQHVFDDLDANAAGRALSGLAFSLAQGRLGDDVKLRDRCGVAAEEAISVAPDAETRAQAERYLGRAATSGYVSIKGSEDRSTLLRGAIANAISMSALGPAQKYRRHSREVYQLFHLLQLA